jgi:GNAT superfamily N-acetyltransferase
LATVRELGPDETHLAHAAMRELRPPLRDLSVQEFVRLVNEVQRPEGYRLVGSFVGEGEGDAAAVAGFRVVNHLAWGRALYCDDLSTRPEHRRRGHAGALMDWMITEAARLGCSEFHLDSGVGADRQDAHRLYFNKGMRITSYHFVVPLGRRGQ